MTIEAYSERFCGLPVVDFRSGDRITGGAVVHRLMQAYKSQETQRELLEQLLSQADPATLQALIIGPWSDAATESPQGYLQGLIEQRLPALRALFVGDMTVEDAEISWITQCDYSLLIDAYPGLEVLRIRGAGGLTLPVTRYGQLRELAIETGGLPDSVVEGIAASDLPQLKHLELWLGTSEYGFDGDVRTYQRLLDRIQPARLAYLGLRDAEIADELAVFLAQQPWLGALDTLDLSMGTLGDRGADALCASPFIRGLKVLDVRHHYISDPFVRRLRALPLTLRIDAAQQADDADDRYVQVSE